MTKLIARTKVTSQGLSALPIELPSLSIHEQALTGIIRIQGNATDSAVISAIRTATQLDVPQSDRYVENEASRLAYTGPNEWLYFVELDAEAYALASLERALVGVFASVAQMSDSRVCFAIHGKDAPNLLAEGCALDFHPSRFPAGVMRTTRFAGTAAAITCVSERSYLLHQDTSIAEFAASWLIEAAREFELPSKFR